MKYVIATPFPCSSKVFLAKVRVFVWPFLFLVFLRVRDLDICFFIRFARNNCLVTCCLWKFSKKRSEAGRRIYFGYWVFLNIFFSACVSKRIDLLLFLFFGQFGICVSLGAEINDCASHNKKLKTNVV